MGVQFSPLQRFGNAHLGAFWKRLGPEWPNICDAPPLPPQFEKFEGERWIEPGLRFTLKQEVNVRIQIRNEGGDRMVQVQNGRFHYNWLGEGGCQYPRYNTVRPEFDNLLEQFRSFVSEEGLGSITEDQWEVTYVNHIPKGSIWNTIGEWAEVFRPVAALPLRAGSARLMNCGGEWSYDIEPKLGRLHVRLQRGRATVTEGPELMIVTLTARGPLGNPESGARTLADGLDLGREAIVKAFYDLTTEKAHRHWGESS
ncbi:MAG: TIGR04255 family protein [Candidatus Hydrogenedentes bacterium]|nr:TIGR04255 family protein [Candidatus Hydrogenedentota bacterium]